MLGIKKDELRFEHDSNLWKKLFADEEKRLLAKADDNMLAVHHIGSTAISGALAKPILDIALEVKELSCLDKSRLSEIGYQVSDLNELEDAADNIYYVKEIAHDVHSHHLYCFASGSEKLHDLLAFRDYLNATPAAVNEYNERKLLYQHDGAAHPDYAKAKSDFITGVIAITNKQ